MVFDLQGQWLFLVPVKGGIGSIFDPSEGKDYKWCISGIYYCQLGLQHVTTIHMGNGWVTLSYPVYVQLSSLSLVKQTCLQLQCPVNPVSRT